MHRYNIWDHERASYHFSKQNETSNAPDVSHAKILNGINHVHILLINTNNNHTVQMLRLSMKRLQMPRSIRYMDRDNEIVTWRQSQQQHKQKGIRYTDIVIIQSLQCCVEHATSCFKCSDKHKIKK